MKRFFCITFLVLANSWLLAVPEVIVINNSDKEIVSESLDFEAAVFPLSKLKDFSQISFLDKEIPDKEKLIKAIRADGDMPYLLLKVTNKSNYYISLKIEITVSDLESSSQTLKIGNLALNSARPCFYLFPVSPKSVYVAEESPKVLITVIDMSVK